MKYLLYVCGLLFIFNGALFSQTVTKVLISGMGGKHDTDVQTAFELGYASYNNSEFTGTITKYFDTGILNSLDYAKDNGYEVIVRSTTGLTTAITYASSYPEVQVFMPSGSNSYELVFSGDIESCPIIVTGAGDENNETGYKVEFYGPDPITIEPDYSSFSNGYIAGQIAYLANSMNETIQQARITAREILGGDNGPDVYDGYGKVDVEIVLNEALPVELITFNAVLKNSNVLLTWQTATEINNYGFEIERLNPPLPSGHPLLGGELKGWVKIGFVNGNGNSNSYKSYSFIDDNINYGVLYYRLKQIDFDGAYEYSDTVGISLMKFLHDFELKQNYPNPFNPVTTIKFTIPNAVDAALPGRQDFASTTLKVYDILGREITTLVNGKIGAGEYEITFDGRDLSSGVYFYKLVSGSYSSTKKLTLVK